MKTSQKRTRFLRSLIGLSMVGSSILISSCTQIQKPASEPFITVTPPPPKQEFRWSNGKLPKSFDPARASAAPETDIVRAIFEGLTEVNKSGDAVPALAEKWTASEDNKIWNFTLRKDARWSNGKRVTASDFVASWKHLQTLGTETAHRALFQNIVGMKLPEPVESTPIEPVEPRTDHDLGVSNASRFQQPSQLLPLKGVTLQITRPLGVEAVNDFTLKVSLELPDKDFPKLVAAPIFRPIYGDGTAFENSPLDAGVVTNGPFRVASVGKDGIVLQRSETYWNKAAVGLERVRLVPKDTAEAALEAYKKGEIDAVTNADFEPLALKLLTPYEDFRQTPHGALNFYEINTKAAPYNDRRIREALAISIDRERLANVELEGAAEPATRLLPLARDTDAELSLDVENARDLLDKAGFPGGAGFPMIRLVVNRNDTQQRVARSVARMWKQNLNLDTLVIVKEPSEIEGIRTAGEFDLIRRGVVLPTADEMVSLTAILGSVVRPVEVKAIEQVPAEPTVKKKEEKSGPSDESVPDTASTPTPSDAPILVTEEDALYELNAIPLYFPWSYSLVRPYVNGFEINGLDAPSLKDVSIDNNWQPKSPHGES